MVSSAGICRQIFEDDEGAIWLAATGGLSRFAERPVRDRACRTRLSGHDLTAITEDDVHDLWIGTGFGILRVSRRDFDEVRRPAARPDSTTALRPVRWSRRPAARLQQQSPRRPSERRPAVVRDLARADASSIRARCARRAAPAPITIEYATADETRMNGRRTGLRLPARTSRLEIDYSELNLTSPLRTRFRYRLDGFDADWIDAGTRRQAFYTNLPPRQYRVPRRRPATPTARGPSRARRWNFSIEPMFYQTTLVHAPACADGSRLVRVGRVAAAAAAGPAPVRAAARRARPPEPRDARHAAAEPGRRGAAVRCDRRTTSRRPTPATQRAASCSMRKQIEEYIREARQSIWDLRSPRLAPPRSARPRCERPGEHADRPSTPMTLRLHGRPATPRPLLARGRGAAAAHRPGSGEQRRPARARRRACAWSSPTTSATVTPAASATTAAASITGCCAETAADHYGLISMRERAEEVGGARARSIGAGRSGHAGARPSCPRLSVSMDQSWPNGPARFACSASTITGSCREGLALIIGRQPDMEVVGSAAIGRGGGRAVRRLQPGRHADGSAAAGR